MTLRFLNLENNAAQMRRKQEALREQARAGAAKLGAARKRAVRWSPEQLKRACGPLVYIWWGESERPLYVGMSKNGLSRCFAANHHNADVLKTAKSVEFICCDSADEAAELERTMIRQLKPQHNKQRY